MSPRKRTLVILASALSGVLAVGAVLAVPAHMSRHGGSFGEFGFGRGIGRALASLDLTDEQKTQVKAILKDEGPKVEPMMDELLRTKKALSEAVHAATFDEKAVRTAASASARASTELAVERARMMSRFREILTDEQKQRLDTIHQQFQERLERRINLGRSIWKEHSADFVDAL